ncbi:MAG: permease [Armatimonadota bacterium]
MMSDADSCCEGDGCCAINQQSSAAPKRDHTLRLVMLLLAGLLAWWLLYRNLVPLASWLTFHVLQLPESAHLGQAVYFFIFETPKVLLLLTLVVFGVGIIRSFFTPERTRAILAGKRESAGNLLAAMLGIVTPFCSCSAVPLFIGFVTTGVPLGVTFSFLIAAPMVNEVALVLLLGLFGWKVAALYLGTGLFIAVFAGWIIGRLHLEHQVESWVYEAQVGEGTGVGERIEIAARLRYGLDAVREIVGKVWIFVVLGIAVGAGIHGYVPNGLMAAIMGKDAWWSVPLAVIIGVPMYSNAAGIIPVVTALWGKGAALGTVLAFMMSVIALSLPEMIILRKVLRPRLIAVFIGVVSAGILVIGYLFNLLDVQQFVVK